MKNAKKIQTFLYSTAGLVAMAVSLIAINVIVRQFLVRVDLTEDRLYTISDGSKKIISELKSPVTLRYYCTRGQNEMPIYLKAHATRIEDLLKEYKLASNGKIKLEKYDPQPDSDAEDAAALDGIDGQRLQSGEKVYLGLAVTSVDQTMSIPFLSPNNERTLEYDITRMIYRVANPAELTIGVMSALPVAGAPAPSRMARQPGQNAWVFVSELRKDHKVREINMDETAIPEDVAILVVVHPKDITDKTLYAIDQFILRGGKLIAFVDPACVVEAQFIQPNMSRPSTPSSTLGKLFDAWGVEFDTTKVLIDMNYPTRIGGQGSTGQLSYAVLTLDNRAMNTDDIISSSLDNIIMAYPGVFSGDAADGLTKTVLIKSSADSQLVDSMKAQLPADKLTREFESDDEEQALAIRLVGKFKTAFPDGAPGDADDTDSSGDQSSTDNAKLNHLTASTNESAVVLIADADLIFDQFWVQKGNFFGQTFLQVFSDNNNFFQNAVEQVSGDSSLISIRSRGVTNRPFLVVKEMQLEAEKKYKQEIGRLEDELSEAQRKVNELQRTKKDQDQQFILSSAQAKELAKFREKQVEVRKKLKELRKQLRRDIDKLENNLKWYNIALMPLVVSIFGIVFAAARKRRMESK